MNLPRPVSSTFPSFNRVAESYGASIRPARLKAFAAGSYLIIDFNWLLESTPPTISTEPSASTVDAAPRLRLGMLPVPANPPAVCAHELPLFSTVAIASAARANFRRQASALIRMILLTTLMLLTFLFSVSGWARLAGDPSARD